MSKIYSTGFSISEFVENEVPITDVLKLNVSNKDLFLAGYPLVEPEAFI